MTVSALLPDLLGAGAIADRPAANAVAGGALYAADDGHIYQSNGVDTWANWATVGGLDAEAVIDLVAAALTDGTNVTITYDDAAGTITIASAGGGGGGASDAASVTFTPTGGLSSTNVQAALAELDSEKAATSALPGAANTTTQGIVELATTTEATTGTDTTRAVTPAGLKAAIDALIAGAPGALDTLNEIATQLATDESAVSALTTTVAGKVPATRTVAGHALSADVTLDDSDIAVVASNSQTGDFTFVLADKHRRTLANKATALTGTIPLNATVPYVVGTILSVMAVGAGQFTWAIAAGGNLRIPHGGKSNGQYTSSYAEKIGTDEWVISGDVTT